MTIDEKQDEIVSRLSKMKDCIDKHVYLVGLAKARPALEERYRTPDNALPGCESRVWVHIETAGGRVFYSADSDSLIIKGILALLTEVLDGHSPDDISKAELDLLRRTGLEAALSPSRARGVAALLRRMQAVT